MPTIRAEPGTTEPTTGAASKQASTKTAPSLGKRGPQQSRRPPLARKVAVAPHHPTTAKAGNPIPDLVLLNAVVSHGHGAACEGDGYVGDAGHPPASSILVAREEQSIPSNWNRIFAIDPMFFINIPFGVGRLQSSDPFTSFPLGAAACRGPRPHPRNRGRHFAHSSRSGNPAAVRRGTWAERDRVPRPRPTVCSQGFRS